MKYHKDAIKQQKENCEMMKPSDVIMHNFEEFFKYLKSNYSVDMMHATPLFALQFFKGHGILKIK
jgi:hypothetical protein